MVTDKRRSDRIMLTVPLHIRGEDERGMPFRDDARTLILNRHGARILIARMLRGGQKVRLSNNLTRREADFRVVGPVAPFTEKGGEFGVEYINQKDNIWGIQFPPPSDDEASVPKALLECRQCRNVALIPLSLVEVEVLGTSGILTKSCEHCGTQSPWGYAEKHLAMGSPSDSALTRQVQAEADKVAKGGAERRRYQRVALQLQVRIRNYYGGVEVGRSENISKGGFCFASEVNYQIGEGLMVVCPFDHRGQSIEVRARVVRRRPMEGTSRNVYGVRYDSHGN
jgi:PilZ domain-containing protein